MRGNAMNRPASLPGARRSRGTEQAIAALIDNAIDARGRNGVTVRVTLDFAARSLAVEDDGLGMDPESLRGAVAAMRPPGGAPPAPGMPGLGMVGACSVLGRRFSVLTSTAESQVEHGVAHDGEAWLSGGCRPQDAFEATSAAKGRPWHGTRIHVSCPNVSLYRQQAGALLAKFGSRYARHLASGSARILVNGRPCVPAEPKLEGGRRPVHIELQDGKKITGWLGVMAEKSRLSCGLALYKGNRIVRISDGFGIRGHPSMSRVTGELHLDHVPTNPQKTRFFASSPEYAEAQQAFGASPVVRSALLDITRSSKETLGPLVKYVTTGNRDGKFRPNVGMSDARNIMAEASAFEFRHAGSPVRFDFVFGDGAGLYEIRKDGPGHLIEVDRNSHVFSAVRNPSSLLAMIWEEAKIALRRPGTHDEFIRERNAAWGAFAGPGPGEPAPPRPAWSRKNVPMSPYLDQVKSVLRADYPHRYQFTALSVLEPFLHYAHRNQFYTILTERRVGRHMQALLSTRVDTDLVVLHRPTREQLAFVPNVAHNTVFVVIREYADVQSSIFASYEKALLDLHYEKRRGLPIGQNEIEMLVEALQAEGVISLERLHRMARHKNLNPNFYADGGKSSR
ncbi:MAG: ATP-binding protein [Thaumarchaeota archaeon]|nr:ATP-binding protein [Nitrososphaerota archaeon]MDD9826269.1 ATP-binding protein [Nitrososphaerota archaeon]MDD9842525.1 ATP-binding protein [Nitrososphaerota archaeon]